MDKTFDIAQNTSTVFTVTFAQKSDVKTGDVTVIENVPTTSGSIADPNYIVREVKMAADGMSATVELFKKLNDGANYSVKIKDFEDNAFTASVGYPKKVVVYVGDKVANNTVIVGDTTDLKCKLYDAKGVDVTAEYGPEAYYYNNWRNAIEYTIKYTDSYELTGDTLYFANKGESAVVKATFHPAFQYDANGVELDVVESDAKTFYAVDRAANTVLDVIDHGVAGTNWSKSVRLNDYSPAYLEVKVSKSKGDPEVFEAYDEQIYVGGEYVGYINFTSMTPDILGVYESSGKVLLEPHAIGKARIAVSYANSLIGEKLIKIVEIDVKEARVMTYAGYKEKNKLICANPGDGVVGNLTATGANTTDVENPTIQLEVKDQDNWGYGNITVLDITGINPVSQEAITKGAVVLNTANGDITVYNRKLDDIMRKMNGDLTADATQKVREFSFGYIVRVKDNRTQAIRNLTFAVNAKRHIGDVDHSGYHGHSLEFALNKWTLDKNSNNIARYWTDAPNSGHVPAEKTLTFKTYEICNTARYDEVEFQPLTSQIARDGSVAVTNGYYFKIFRNGVDVTNKALNNTTTSGRKIMTVAPTTTTDYGTVVTYLLSDWKVDNYGKTVVTYTNDDQTIGAATYEFVLYEAKNYKSTRLGSKATTVGLDTGKYELTFRNKITADSRQDMDILQCFNIKDRNGKEYEHNYYAGQGNVTNTHAKFADNAYREYKIVYDSSKINSTNYREGDTLFVEKVIFYEPVGSYDHDGDPTTAEVTINAAYEVPVNKAVDFKNYTIH